MKKQFLKHLTLLFLSGALLFSCGKNKENDTIDLDPNTTSDNANAQSVSDDALKLSEDVLTANSSAKIAAGASGVACATVDTTVLGPNHIVFTITFSGLCTNYDGRVRTGQMTVDLNGASYNTPGAVITVSTSNYTVSGVKFSGKKTVTCVEAGKHNIVVSDATGTGYATITYLNGDVASWRTKRTRTLVSGGGNSSITDNVYDISATTGVGNPVAEGVNREGRHYVVNINSPIRINFNCFTNNTARYPTQGILEIIPDGKNSRTVDYGSGACDNTVVVSVGGKTKEVNLSY